MSEEERPSAREFLSLVTKDLEFEADSVRWIIPKNSYAIQDLDGIPWQNFYVVAFPADSEDPVANRRVFVAKIEYEYRKECSVIELITLRTSEQHKTMMALVLRGLAAVALTGEDLIKEPWEAVKTKCLDQAK